MLEAILRAAGSFVRLICGKQEVRNLLCGYVLRKLRLKYLHDACELSREPLLLPIHYSNRFLLFQTVNYHRREGTSSDRLFS